MKSLNFFLICSKTGIADFIVAIAVAVASRGHIATAVGGRCMVGSIIIGDIVVGMRLRTSNNGGDSCC